MLVDFLLALLAVLFLGKNVGGAVHGGGVLFPRESETREVKSLDGMWNFVVQDMHAPFDGFNNFWYKKSLKSLAGTRRVFQIPVPASYNDITTDASIRDHVGLVWYDRTFFVPPSWRGQRIWIRFGSVSYAAQVWINGELVISHEIGHLPFAAEVTDLVKLGQENLVTVACDNTLLADTVPQGEIQDLNNRLVQTFSFDFFNYAGIDRPVYIYTTPKTFIDDLTVQTALQADNQEATIYYNITIIGNDSVDAKINLFDHEDNLVVTTEGSYIGSFKIKEPKLWWPYLMHEQPGYLYKLQVVLTDPTGQLIDSYTQPIGIRSLKWTETSLLINGKPIYLHGFGRHEDSDIRGKGLDLPLITRDYELIKWIGANVYRTSHYPYAEEIMDLADQYGIMIIDECPSVDTEKFSESLLAKHKKSLTELIKRDKNRPSVIMWSAANEPRTASKAAGDYFQQVIAHIKSLDSSRPTTIVEAQGASVVYSSQYVDIISFNRYNAWYSNAGLLDVIRHNVITEATAWHSRFNKPVMMMEYGADTLEGLHFLPEFIWSEEYQTDLMSQHFEAFDQLREEGWFIGEFIWNFADFKTGQSYTRVGGNKKGIFTRNRQPKSSAFHLRRRYWNLANQYYNVSLPNDLDGYVISSTKKRAIDEL